MFKCVLKIANEPYSIVSNMFLNIDLFFLVNILAR